MTVLCISCGNDVTGKKFCSRCGTPVQAMGSESNQAPSVTCPRCGGEVALGTAYCIHCGSVLHASVTPVAPTQAAMQTCPSCHGEVLAGNAFCVHCGQDLRSAIPHQDAAAVFCSNCGQQNAPGMRFCAHCGSQLSVPPAQVGYAQYSQGQPAPQPYGQPSYQPQYMQPYGQPGSQQPMLLRCPVCMAYVQPGTANCPGCRTSLVGVAPAPVNSAIQGQQGGPGGLFQGNGGNMAMGALGGAAAVIGGEILLNELEHGHHHRHEEGLLGDIGDIANDIGLF